MYLSKGGRVTLIKSTLFNLPTYFLSLFPIHPLANRMEKLQCDFLWGGLGEDFKYHLVNWSKVCSPIFEGGLGTLCKWKRGLVEIRCGCEIWLQLWRVVFFRSPRGVWGGRLWKYIKRAWSFFLSHTRFDSGDGSKIRFWDDVWCGETSLKGAFPILYNIANVKDATVATNMDLSSRTFQWNIIFIRLIHDWEVGTLASFYALLYSLRSRKKREDKLWWTPSCKWTFDVRSFYKIITF